LLLFKASFPLVFNSFYLLILIDNSLNFIKKSHNIDKKQTVMSSIKAAPMKIDTGPLDSGSFLPKIDNNNNKVNSYNNGFNLNSSAYFPELLTSRTVFNNNTKKNKNSRSLSIDQFSEKMKAVYTPDVNRVSMPIFGKTFFNLKKSNNSRINYC
jgi:hypothetical protein